MFLNLTNYSTTPLPLSPTHSDTALQPDDRYFRFVSDMSVVSSG